MMYQKYFHFLKKYVSFASISTDSSYTQKMYDTAEWLAEQCTGFGMQVDVVEGYGNPIVLASYQVNKNLPTCLIYGHYDVQPAKKDDGRDHDPFDVQEKDGKLIARGIVDNKGQLAIHLHTISQLINRNKLGYNIKFLIEGNEETGSPLLSKFMHDYKDNISADFCLISDGEIVGESPAIDAGFRGGANMTIKLTTGKTDLHSGIYGGVAPNASLELTRLLSQLYNQSGQITVPYFYYDVDVVSSDIIKQHKNIGFDAEAFKSQTGYKKLFGAYDYYTQTGLQPSIEITGMTSGYTSEGYRNAIPSTATAKLNIRTVANQNPDHIIKNIAHWLQKKVPDYVSIVIDASDPYPAMKTDLSNAYLQKAVAILETVYDKKVIYHFSGGGLPIVKLFADMGIPQVLVPLANDDCNMHGVGENYRIDLIQKGLLFAEKFLGKDG